eukprot:CAMPEP_0194395382 /NCGR_PEP_ID=MMETSP0174-20130528/124391_1 /TAXON_ID=216777 /ORGANISM="Proboscia alata, Strain PI-D3" /LENGTH=415 /DNA_ID=CAMNT_0039191309 /DNA_START=144 /DNA_END=1388 /DNA_ORIENTATION=-
MEFVEANQCLSSSVNNESDFDHREKIQKVNLKKELIEIDCCLSVPNFEHECSSLKIADQLVSSSRIIENGSGCQKLIRKKKSSKLPDIEAINAKVVIRILSRQSQWEDRYKELVSYVEEFGNARVSTKFAKNPALGNWVSAQRTNYRNVRNINISCKTQRRISLLNKIGFEWSIFGCWDGRYEELVKYVKEFGNARVPFRFAENPSLGWWVHGQRSNYRKFENGKRGLTKDQVRLLHNIGFEWNLNRKQSTSSHNGRNKDLASYTKESSDIHVPQQFADIHLLDAANQYLSSSVNNENDFDHRDKIQKVSLKNELKESDCCSSAPNIEHECSSLKIADQLVSSSRIIENGSGCRKLIRKKTSSKLPDIEAIKATVEICILSRESQWENRYKELVSYVEEFGDARVPSKFAENPSL